MLYIRLKGYSKILNQSNAQRSNDQDQITAQTVTEMGRIKSERKKGENKA